MATNVFSVGNVIFRGIMVDTVASSFSASLQLINDHVAPVSNIANTENSWVLIGKYKRPYCILILLCSG